MGNIRVSQSFTLEEVLELERLLVVAEMYSQESRSPLTVTQTSRSLAKKISSMRKNAEARRVAFKDEE